MGNFCYVLIIMYVLNKVNMQVMGKEHTGKLGRKVIKDMVVVIWKVNCIHSTDVGCCTVTWAQLQSLTPSCSAAKYSTTHF